LYPDPKRWAGKFFDLGGLAKVNLTGNDDDPWQQTADQGDDPECLARFSL